MDDPSHLIQLVDYYRLYSFPGMGPVTLYLSLQNVSIFVVAPRVLKSTASLVLFNEQQDIAIFNQVKYFISV